MTSTLQSIFFTLEEEEEEEEEEDNDNDNNNDEDDVYLNRLSMRFEDIDTHDRIIEFGVSGLHNLVVEVVFVTQRIEPFEHKFKECLQIFGRWRCHKNIRITAKERMRKKGRKNIIFWRREKERGVEGEMIPEYDCSCDSETECSRFASTTRGSECDSAAQRLLGDCFKKSQNRFSLGW
jgi:hypothetical protein